MDTNTEDHTGKIVVGVDGSASSLAALRQASRQARLTGDELHAYIAWHFPANYGWAAEGIEFADDARSTLEQAITDAALDDTATQQVHRHVVEGHPAWVLLNASDGADLLVVGSRGHGGFTGMLLGSVSQHAVAHAHCPVLVVRDITHNRIPG